MSIPASIMLMVPVLSVIKFDLTEIAIEIPKFCS